jgi:lambda family phage tail tape measure protein
LSDTNNQTIRYSVDASGVEAGVSKLVSQTTRVNQAMAQTADRADKLNKVEQALAEQGLSMTTRQMNAVIGQMDRLRDAMTKTRVDQFADRLNKLGLGNAFASEVADLKNLESAAKGAHSGMAGISRELMVMGHEALTGNFKRLGGSAMVLGERINVLQYLLSPLGGALALAAAAAAAFGYEVYEGYEQINAFNRAITSTGGFLGLSAAQMAEMANGLQSTSSSLTTVRDAMAQVASTGAFTGDQLQLATRAALAMASDIGVGTDKAAESLARIQDNVTEWISKYQQAHHAFTASQVEEIENFVKQGDTVSAVKAVMQDLASAHAKIEADANAHMGAVMTWWHQWGDAIDQVKAKILSIGTPDSIDKQVGDQYARVEAAQRNLKQQASMGAFGNIASAQQALDIETKKLQALRDQQTVEHKSQQQREAAAKSGDAKVAVNSYLDSDKYATPGQRHSLDLQKENEAFKKATANLDKNSADYQAALKRHYENVQQINEQYGKKSGADRQQQNVLSGQMASLQGRNQLIEQATKEHLERLKVAYASGAMDQELYLKQVHDVQASALDQEISNAEQRAQLAQGKKQLSAAQAANTEYQKLLAQRKAIDDEYTDALKQAQKARTDAYEKYAAGNQKTVDKQKSGYQLEDATRYMSPQQKTDYSQQITLYENYMEQMQALRDKFDFDPKSDKLLEQQELQNLTDTYNQQQQMLQQHLQDETEVRGNYEDQMTLAMTQLSGNGQTAAQTTADAFTKAWQDSTSALNSFIATGKGDFDQFVVGVLADMAKIALQWAEMQAMQGLLGMVGSGDSFSGGSTPATALGAASWGLGSVLGHADGGHITGAGTGTSDSIPSMLSNGEYVINAASTKKYRGLLDSINSGNLSHFATGGPVGSVGSASGSGSNGGANPVSVVVNHNGGGGLSDQDAKDLHRMVQSFVDQRMSFQMKRQGGYAYQIRYGQI